MNVWRSLFWMQNSDLKTSLIAMLRLTIILMERSILWPSISLWISLFSLSFLIPPPQSWGGNSTVIRAPLFVRLSVLLSVRDGFFGTFLLSPWPNLTHYHTSPTECLWVKDVQSTLTLNHVSRFKVKFIANTWPFTHLEYKYIIVFSNCCIFYTCYINKKVILIELQFACLKLGKINIYNRI